ncbi:general transcription factor 3C polypeptide 5 [Centruroides vittatus]|uniref:general transcription factor 3C polypeptide 5 n=1 Tax=Centruroides vittatus TaxID=120091 RepID=UPI00350F5CA1
MCDVTFHRKKLVCVEYPGVVQNVNKMIQTLNGQEHINQVYSEPSRRLELCYRPRDIHCKCAHGDRFNTTSLLMKVKRVRKKRAQLDAEGDDDEFNLEIVGIIDTTYKFRGMMDFQYLPMVNTPKEGYKSIIPTIIPRGLQFPSWYKESSPLFIMPVMFSRLDMPSNYNFRRDSVAQDVSKAQKTKTPPNIIGKTRQTRFGYTTFLNFEDEVPTEPMKNAKEHMKMKCGDSLLPEKVQKLFEERPIWSKNALTAQLDCDPLSLKAILPVLAYYYVTGPWRSLWVRFGYDPKKNPESKIYQQIDFRVRSTPGKEVIVESKRGNSSYTLPNKINLSQARIAKLQREELASKPGTSEGTEKENKSYTFGPDRLPHYRQNFYQLCDIDIPEVQDVIHSNDNYEMNCMEKGGWLKPGALERCREIMVHHMNETIEKLKEKQEGEKIIEPSAVQPNDSDNSYLVDLEDESLDYEEME